MSHSQDIPIGLCQCGCGGKTSLAAQTDSRIGHVRGQHVRFINGHQRRKSPVDYIEEDRGHETPCWIWQKATSSTGYGKTRLDGRLQSAHRVYYERHVGPIPDGLHIDHLCRVRACVNPDHLEPVTHAENLRRGASPKLDHTKVREIRASSSSSRELALRFGVHERTIQQVQTGRSWRVAHE